MKILFLTNNPVSEPIYKWLSKTNKVIKWEKPLTLDDIYEKNFDFYISYNYKYIIPLIVVHYCFKKLINLHISYLPYNRGADPVFWSIVEGTPSGVTIHYINDGIDTGEIIVQEKIPLKNNDTLVSAYKKLHLVIQKLFKTYWKKIRKEKILSHPQEGFGTYHRKKDFYDIEVRVLKRLQAF